MSAGWLTNNPKVADQLRAADQRYELARLRAQGFTMADKVQAYRVAKAAREAEYQDILANA